MGGLRQVKHLSICILNMCLEDLLNQMPEAITKLSVI